MKQPRNFRLPPDVDTKLRQESERTGIPQTGIVIAALKNWFKYEQITYTFTLHDGKTAATITANGATEEAASTS